MATLKKQKPSFPEGCSSVVAITSFSHEGGVVNTGDEFPGDHPLPAANPSWFCDAETPTKELPNTWTNLMPDPPDHRPPARTSAPIPPERLVRSRASFWFDGGFAAGSLGEKSGKISGFGWGISIGQLVEITNSAVQAHPDCFEWPTRDVRPLTSRRHWPRMRSRRWRGRPPRGPARCVDPSPGCLLRNITRSLC